MRALRIDDTLAEAHASLAKILLLFDLNWEEAEKEFRRAIELNSNYATAHQWYGEYLISMGRFDEAKAEMKLALDNDPVSLAINLAQGFPYYYDGEYDEAIAAYKKALELDRPLTMRTRVSTMPMCRSGCTKRLSLSLWRVTLIGQSFNRGSRRSMRHQESQAFWEAQVSVPEEKVARCTMYSMAQDHALAGARDKAFRWLERCYDRRESLTALKVDPYFDNLRSDPRFTDLLLRMRLEP